MKTKVAGIVGLSTYLPLRSKIQDALGPNKDTPVLMCHGDSDMVVNYNWGKLSAEHLKTLGISIDFKTYRSMGHSSSQEELRDLAAFLKRVIA